MLIFWDVSVLLVPLAYTIVSISTCVTLNDVFTNLFLGVKGKRYGIVNETLIGACFLPCGIGNASKAALLSAITSFCSPKFEPLILVAFFALVGAPLSGWISDMVIIRSRRKRGGLWYPEDRLKATLFGIFLPIAIILSGVITKYVPGPVGLVGNLVCLFFTGVAVR